VLRYSRDHLFLEYGGLGDQKLDLEEYAAFEITVDALEQAWLGA
jgi:hypothetical protein